MKYIVSFETAKKLEISGFERPNPEIGQFWYDDNQCAPLCISSISRGYVFARHTHKHELPLVMMDDRDFRYCTYAPAATDLLEQLPDCKMRKHGGFWFVEKLEIEFVNENAAEAVAEAYLSQSK